MKSNRLIIIVLLGFLWLSFPGCQPEKTAYYPQKGPLKTRWTDKVQPGKTWQEYPRPQMVRSNWKNLNGLWEYAITPAALNHPDSMQGRILVPYPVESALSGVMKKVSPDQKLWYLKQLRIPIRKKSTKVLLHFEAVDWEMKAWLDGQEIGTHRGGYDPFTFDITSMIRPGHTQKLLVSVWDPTTDGIAPIGKQHNRPHGIWYTPSSGIWQTVWLEIVPESYIRNYKIYPDIDRDQAIIQVAVNNSGTRDHLEIILIADGKKVGTFKGDIGETVQMKIHNPHLWSPDDPYLYDLRIRLMRKGNRMDEVKGYFGMRKISLGKDNQGFTRILLNNRFVFQSGPLDQGFWPDGLYTPPSDEAMKYDLEILKKMGFNMLRKHVKVEPRRFYYHTDHMGLLVWQDMPSMFTGVFGSDRSADQIKDAKSNFDLELTELVNDHFNHPSIVMWVPFNEGWGQHDTPRIVSMVRSLDSTRLIDNASGWTDRGAGDVHDIHSYPDPRAPEPEESRAIVLGEFGGLGLNVPGHVWRKENWGYEKFSSAEELLTKYEKLWQEVFRLRDEAGLSAAVYTQTTDVETEGNGLMTYDRDSVKMGLAAIAQAHAGKLPPSLIRISRSSFLPVSSDIQLLLSDEQDRPIDINLPSRSE